MTGFDAIKTLQIREIAAARGAGEEFFLDLPDSWYEPAPTYGCENGHASRRYLSSEANGAQCLACCKPVVLLPIVYDTDEKLTAALNAIKSERATQAAKQGEQP